MSAWTVWVIFAACGLMIYLFNRLRVNSPVYVLGFVDRFDWKFFNGKGVEDFRGKKVFVMVVVGILLGALVGKMALGLIVGSFLGAAMEL